LGLGLAAIAVRRRTSPTEYSSEFHSAYYPLGTNNIAEAIALLAGLRKAHRMLTEGDTKVNIISDSEILYKMTLGVAKCEDKKLVPILCQIKDAFMPVAGRVVLDTMRRQRGNPADTVCTKAILKPRAREILRCSLKSLSSPQYHVFSTLHRPRPLRIPPLNLPSLRI
jgi:ribonuclease HI